MAGSVVCHGQCGGGGGGGGGGQRGAEGGWGMQVSFLKEMDDLIKKRIRVTGVVVHCPDETSVLLLW